MHMLAGESEYYVWRVPGRSVVVHLRRRAMDYIADMVREAFQSVPRRGAETGGILLGSKTLQNGHPVILVEAAEQIRCEHQMGPSFLLSPRDRDGLAAAMERLKSEGLVPVGFFRSHTRDQISGEHLTLNPADEEMLKTWLPGAASVFLLVRPFSLARIVANLLFWHEGRVLRETDFIPFPFAETVSGLAPSIPQARKSGAVAESESRPVSDGRRRFLAIAGSVALAAALGFGAFEVLNHRVLAGGVPTTPLELTAEPAGRTLTLRWDPATVSKADRADVVIQDGLNNSRYQLSRQQLGSGSLQYTPATESVTFSLEAKLGKSGMARGVLTVINSRL